MNRLFHSIDLLLYTTHPRMIQRFVKELGYMPRIASPCTYHEKMLWRMIFDHNPQFVTLSDKLGARARFSAKCPEVHLPRILWQGRCPEELPLRFLNENVVIKANHGCRYNWFSPRQEPDADRFRRKLRRWLRKDHSNKRGEWAYSEISRQLFVEELVDVARPGEMIELKVHVFHGRVFYTVVYMHEKTPQSLSAIFDVTGKRLSVTNSVVAKDPGRALPADFKLPACYRDAMDAAVRVAGELDYLRVDFMISGERLYGGEITVYPSAGLMTNSCTESMAALGDAWDIRRSWFLSASHKGWRRQYARYLHKSLNDGDVRQPEWLGRGRHRLGQAVYRSGRD